MIKQIRKYGVYLVLLLTFFAAPGMAYAYNPLGSACGTSGGGTSTACSASASDPITGSNGVLHRASLLLSIIAGVAAVIVIIISGFRFITSSGDPQKAAGARSALIGAIVGLIIIVLAESLVLFVLSKL